MSENFKCEVYKSTLLNLCSHRYHKIECSVTRGSDGEHFIDIGNTMGWCSMFCTGLIGDGLVKINNCLCWEESGGDFRAVYIDFFCKFGDIRLYATACGNSAQKASMYAVEAWRGAKREIIKMIDNDIGDRS